MNAGPTPHSLAAGRASRLRTRVSARFAVVRARTPATIFTRCRRCRSLSTAAGTGCARVNCATAASPNIPAWLFPKPTGRLSPWRRCAPHWTRPDSSFRPISRPSSQTLSLLTASDPTRIATSTLAPAFPPRPPAQAVSRAFFAIRSAVFSGICTSHRTAISRHEQFGKTTV